MNDPIKIIPSNAKNDLLFLSKKEMDGKEINSN